MIDLTDETQKYYYLGYCMSGSPIEFYGEHIYQITVKDIFDDITEQIYNSILLPYVTPIQYYENISEKYTLYDAITTNGDMVSLFLLSLSVFMRKEIKDIKTYKKFDKRINANKIQIMINNNILTSQMFDELRQIILLICNVRENKYIKNDNKPMSEKKKKLLTRRKENNFNEVEYKRVKLINVYNYVVHQDNIVDYDKWLNYSIYRIYNSYNNLMQKENTRFIYDVVSHGFGDKKTKLEPYVDKILK